MIISISGHIDSGKDTAGQIIQWIIDHSHTSQKTIGKDKSYNSFIMDIGRSHISSWQIKKWAGPLRKVAAILLEMDEEFLYTDEFKQMVLPECWGKVMQASRGQEYNELMTGREFLQKLGTDAIRDRLHENAWVNALMSQYKPHQRCTVWEDEHTEPGPYYHPKCIGCNDGYFGYKLQPYCKNCAKVSRYPNIIITDTRFPNELAAVKKHDGITIRIKRPLPFPKTIIISRTALDKYEVLFDENNPKHLDLFRGEQLKNLHESETALDNATFDYEIINDSTIEQLIEKLKNILINKQILTHEPELSLS